MKKILLFISMFFLLNQTYADFVVKKTTSWDETYNNEITQISTDTSISFEITAIWWITQKEFIINLPAWFLYNSHSFSWTCNTQITTSQNSAIKYSFSWTSNCISKVNFSYTPTIAWNYTISILENNTLNENVKVWVIWDNTIIKALCLDQNSDGYVDSYELHFAKAITNIWDYLNIKVWWESVSWYNWNTFSWVISFIDGKFKSWELPQILSNNMVFWNVALLNNDSIKEEDLAKPVILSINNWLAINWNDDFIFEFSESIKPNPQIILKDKNWTNIVFTTQTNTWKSIYQLNPNTTLFSYNNPYIYDINLQDWSWNKLIQTWSINIVVNSCSTQSVANWVISWFPSCTLTCNSWYTISWNTCISSWWWGWGGWGWWGWGFTTPTCDTKKDLECSIYNFAINYNKTKNLENKYIYKVNSWKDIIYKTNIEIIKQPLEKIEKIILNKYKKLLSSNTISKKQYDEAINNYNNFVFYLSVYRLDKTSLSKQRGKEYLSKVIKTYNLKIKKTFNPF